MAERNSYYAYACASAQAHVALPNADRIIHFCSSGAATCQSSAAGRNQHCYKFRDLACRLNSLRKNHKRAGGLSNKNGARLLHSVPAQVREAAPCSIGIRPQRACLLERWRHINSRTVSAFVLKLHPPHLRLSLLHPTVHGQVSNRVPSYVDRERSKETGNTVFQWKRCTAG